MKIIFFIKSLTKEAGISVVEIIKANALVDKGHEVVICHNDPLEPGKKTLRPISPKVKVICLALDNILEVKRTSLKWFKLLSLYRKRIQSIIDAEAPNVIVATEGYSKFVLPFISKPKGVNAIKIREFHNASDSYKSAVSDRRMLAFLKIYHRVGRAFQSLCYDRMFLLTKADKEANYPHNSKYDYVYNPLTINVLPPPEINMCNAADKQTDSNVEIGGRYKRNHTVLFVGRLAFPKNVAALLRIWSHTEHEGWTLKIVGDGYEMDSLKALTASLSIQDSVEFAGWVNDPRPIMQDASILCLTSINEGFALVIAEAMASGLPVVSYNLPYGPSDIITDGEDGLLIPYLDEDAFAKKLSGLMDDEEKIRSMSKSAILKSQQFSVDKIVDTWIAKYNELLS
jgi:glycosyltransferase involved in cell wall biosynthesis